jgi:hypothetical protein
MNRVHIALAALTAALPVLACAGQWQYDTVPDKMTSKVTATAILTSDNSLDLAFPYKGANYGRINVRQHPRHGLDVIIDVDKGQILCRSYSGCPILVRFDDRPPRTFSGSEPADNNSTVAFIRDARGFIAEAKRAKRILVQVNMFQQGAQTLEFSTPAPLAWPPGNTPAKAK